MTKKQQPAQPAQAARGRRTTGSTPTIKKAGTINAPRPTGAPAKHAALSKKQRDEHYRQVLMRTIAIVGAMILLIIIIGAVYQFIIFPGQTLAKVSQTRLTRSDYWHEQRIARAQDIAQNMFILALYGDNEQVANQFANQSPLTNATIAAIHSEKEVDDSFLTSWQEQQLIIQGAAQLGIDVSSSEIEQRIAADMAEAFLDLPAADSPASDVVTSTDTLSVTDGMTETIGNTTPTPFATTTPVPTPDVATAQQQVPQIVEKLHQMYADELQTVKDMVAESQMPATNLDFKVRLSKDEFRAALVEQYRMQALTEKIRDALVPEDTFEASDEPAQIGARHILLAVDVPDDATEKERDKAFAKREADAEALAEELRDGGNFSELARTRSDDDGSRERGGDVGFFDADGVSDTGAVYAPAFVEAAMQLDVGEISEPVRTPFGWHIIEVTDRQVPSDDEQLQQARSEAFNTWLEEQRMAAASTFVPTLAPTPTNLPDTEPTPAPTYVPGPPTMPAGDPSDSIELVPGDDGTLTLPAPPTEPAERDTEPDTDPDN